MPMSKERKYRKDELRWKLQENLGQSVSKLEFAKWIRWFSEMTHWPDEIIRAKKLDEEEVAALEEWLGYKMR